jgi:xylitol oxidase
VSTNWAGNYAYTAARVHEPSSLDELRAIVLAAPRFRVLGSRHSFNDIADGSELVSLRGLPADVSVSDGALSFSGGQTYGDLAACGVAVHNLASLPHISVAGAVATATHGSGDGNGNLATAVRALELLTSDGELLRVERGDADFDGMVVGLGALGVVTRLTLDAEPEFTVRQRIFEDLPWATLFAHFDAVTAAAYSVSLFTRWGPTVEQVWLKCRGELPEEFFGAAPAQRELHPIRELSPVNTTPQRGAPGPSWERLPHFRMGFTPSNGDELQSEYLIAREHAIPALEALLAIAGVLAPRLQVSEIRTVAADTLWMSTAYRRDSVALHFTWQPGPIDDVLLALESALAPFDPRPHWGKLFLRAPVYERQDDFLALRERLDARGALRNPWFARTVG